MIECKSCGVFMEPEAQIKTLPDGTLYIDEFCEDCVTKYVTNSDSLDWKEYAFESLTGVNNTESYDFDD